MEYKYTIIKVNRVQPTVTYQFNQYDGRQAGHDIRPLQQLWALAISSFLWYLGHLAIQMNSSRCVPIELPVSSKAKSAPDALPFVIGYRYANLELGQRKGSSQTRPRTIHESQ